MKTRLEPSDQQRERKRQKAADENDLMGGIGRGNALDDEILEGEDEHSDAHEGDAMELAAPRICFVTHPGMPQNEDRPITTMERSTSPLADNRPAISAPAP